MRILVTRTGSPLWWGIMNSKSASAAGECDTEPLIKRLIDFGYEVGYYGQIRNYIPDPKWPLKLFEVDLLGLGASDQYTGKQLEEHLRERCDPVIDEIIAWGPALCIEMCGDSYTWYRPDNDKGVKILDVCWRYGFYAGYMYHRTKLDRNIIVTDPALYPKNGEMMGSWPETMPRRVLSQEEKTWEQIIQGKKVKIRAKYAACEHWQSWQMKPVSPTNTRPNEIVIASHTHHKRANQNTAYRSTLWDGILKQCYGMRTRMCGRGWDELDTAHPQIDSYVGVLKTFTDVMEFLQTGVGGPVVAQKLGFGTSKARFYALNGACPYLFDRDRNYRYCYDRDERIMHMDDVARWDWQKTKPKCCDMSEDERQHVISMVLQRTEPCYDALFRLIDIGTGAVTQDLGGYRLC